MANGARVDPDCCMDAEFLAQGRARRAAAAASGADTPHRVIGADAEPLRGAFNAQVGTVRVVMLVSPTCGPCLDGAAAVPRALAERPQLADVPVHVVWVPMLRAAAPDVPLATRVVPDARAAHYWDADGVLGRGYRAVLGLDEAAWDVYALYGPDARWDDILPPAPASWMHQLGTAQTPRATAPYLNPAVFAARAVALLRPSLRPSRAAAHATAHTAAHATRHPMEE